MRARTVYGALLRCYPAAFRHEYGDQMFLMFDEQLRQARRSGRWIEQIALWLRAALDILIVAPKEHWHLTHHDIRYALRTMAAKPGFAVIAIVSLALGIGANIAIFGLWNGVLRAPLPVVDKPEQLVMLTDPAESGGWTGRWDGRTDGPRAWLTYEEFEDLRDHADAFGGLMASQSSLGRWRVRHERSDWEEARGRLVSGGFFQLLAVRAFVGRLFTTEDDRVDAPHAVISYPYWQRRFGGSPDVIGRTFTIRDTALTIIGVTPPGFVGETVGQQPDFWLPLRTQPRVLPGRDRLHDTPPQKNMWLHVFGRLRPGVTAAQAQTQANAIFQAGLESFYRDSLAPERRVELRDERLRVTPAARGASPARSQFSGSLTALLAAVAALLLIACANLANLLLARGAARRTEIAVRLSLGASRDRIIRQLVTESMTLAVIGGLAAIVVAFGLHGLFVGMLAASDSRFRMNFVLDPMILVFAVATTMVAALVFGALPAWHASRSDVAEGLAQQGRVGAALGRTRSGRLLVGLQLACSLPLLVGAGLLARTVYNLQHADLGYRSEGLSLVEVDLKEVADSPARIDRLRGSLLDGLRQIPGVNAVSFSQLGLFSGGNSAATIAVEGYTPQGEADRGSSLDVVGVGYFSTLGIPVLKGREFTDRDTVDALKVCVINETFAAQFFAGRNPLGLHLTVIHDEHDRRVSYEVVGVTRDARTEGLRGAIKPRYFVAASQDPEAANNPTFLIRSSLNAASVMPSIRKTIQRISASLPIESATSLEETLAPLTAQDRATAQLVLIFGSVALALAAIGLYGVLSYSVAGRTGEIAIRIALGARPARVIAMILRETSGLVLAGLAVGGGLAAAAARLIGTRLYGVEPQDPATLAFATGLLLLVAFVAAYWPARRASRLDPMVALRQA